MLKPKAKSVLEKNPAAVFRDYPTAVAITPPKGAGFIPVLSKIDLASAYYQLPTRKPHLNSVALWHPHEGKWVFRNSSVMTFGNRRSVTNLQSLGVIISRFLSLHGITFSPYLDDYVIISRPELAEAEFKTVLHLLRHTLGLDISDKHDGCCLGQPRMS